MHGKEARQQKVDISRPSFMIQFVPNLHGVSLTCSFLDGAIGDQSCCPGVWIGLVIEELAVARLLNRQEKNLTGCKGVAATSHVQCDCIQTLVGIECLGYLHRSTRNRQHIRRPIAKSNAQTDRKQYRKGEDPEDRFRLTEKETKTKDCDLTCCFPGSMGGFKGALAQIANPKICSPPMEAISSLGAPSAMMRP